jgi:hypothetical protein
LGNWIPNSATVEKDGDYEGAVIHDNLVLDNGLAIDGPKLLERLLVLLKKDVPTEQYDIHWASMKERLERIVVENLAGLAAVCRYRRLSRSNSDVAKAVEIVTEGSILGHDIAKSMDILRVYEPDEDKCCEWFDYLWERTYQSVRKWMPNIRRVAKVLKEQRTLDRQGIIDVHKMIDKMEAKRKGEEGKR